MTSYLKLSECQDRCIYRINSRNLDIGVFNSKDSGFIGIREKFGDKYLFTEYHYDTGAPFGTVKPIEKIGELPEDIMLSEVLATIDQRNGKLVKFDTPISEGGKGWFYVDTNESDKNIRPVFVPNSMLFDFLNKYNGEHS